MNFLKDALSVVRSLKDCPYELFVVNVMTVFNAFAYFSMCTVFTIYLSSKDHGYSDRQSSMLYGIWGFLTSLYGWIAGPLIDKWGLKTSMVVGALFASLGQMMFALSLNKPTLYLSLFVFMPIGNALGMPVTDIAGNRFSFKNNKKFVFGLLFSAMHAGASMGALTVDYIRNGFAGDDFHYMGYSASSERIIILLGAIFMLLNGLIASVTIRDVMTTSHGNIVPFEREFVQEDGSDPWHRRAMHTAKRVFSDKMMWRATVFTAVMFGARQIHRHLDATLPKWALRAIGPDAQIGTMSAIHPALIVVFSPIVSILLSRVDIYTSFIVGSFISSISLVFLWGKASFAMTVLFFFLYTAGEAIYSPQVKTFVLNLAPRGGEGTYTQLANAPTFMSKLAVGLISGMLLEKHCPDDTIATVKNTCNVVWIVVACISVTTPVFLILLRPCLYGSYVRAKIDFKTGFTEEERSLPLFKHSDDSDL